MIVNLDLPPNLYSRAAEIAKSQQLSVADLLAAACADRAKFLEVLAKVPYVPPDEADQITP